MRKMANDSREVICEALANLKNASNVMVFGNWVNESTAGADASVDVSKLIT